MLFFFFNDTATTEIYTLSLHDALPIWRFSACGVNVLSGTYMSTQIGDPCPGPACDPDPNDGGSRMSIDRRGLGAGALGLLARSEEHTSELQSRQYLVCRLLLEKKNRVK